MHSHATYLGLLHIIVRLLFRLTTLKSNHFCTFVLLCSKVQFAWNSCDEIRANYAQKMYIRITETNQCQYMYIHHCLSRTLQCLWRCRKCSITDQKLSQRPVIKFPQSLCTRNWCNLKCFPSALWKYTVKEFFPYHPGIGHITLNRRSTCSVNAPNQNALYLFLSKGSIVDENLR